jgi:hypothetical protein
LLSAHVISLHLVAIAVLLLGLVLMLIGPVTKITRHGRILLSTNFLTFRSFALQLLKSPSMFFKNKFHTRPLGVPLDELERVLSTTTLKISRDADSLIAKHETAVTKLKVIPPARGEWGEDAAVYLKEQPFVARSRIRTKHLSGRKTLWADNLETHVTM